MQRSECWSLGGCVQVDHKKLEFETAMADLKANRCRLPYVAMFRLTRNLFFHVSSKPVREICINLYSFCEVEWFFEFEWGC